MTERPILFSAPMVQAILAGKKTQTRRIVTVPWQGSRRALPYEPYWVDDDGKLLCCDEYGDYHEASKCMTTYGEPGDRLWVRETFHSCPQCPQHQPGGYTAYRSDEKPLPPKCAAHGWRPSIFMRRHASRITLEVTGIRIERLQTITESDAVAEGVEPYVSNERWSYYDPRSDAYIDCFHDPTGEPNVESPRHHPAKVLASARAQYATLWDNINEKRGSWETNPWVWVVDFRRVAP